MCNPAKQLFFCCRLPSLGFFLPSRSLLPVYGRTTCRSAFLFFFVIILNKAPGEENYCLTIGDNFPTAGVRTALPRNSASFMQSASQNYFNAFECRRVGRWAISQISVVFSGRWCKKAKRTARGPLDCLITHTWSVLITRIIGERGRLRRRNARPPWTFRKEGRRRHVFRISTRD